MFPRVLVLNVNPPNSREGSKRARKIDHKPSAVRSKVFFVNLGSSLADKSLLREVKSQTYTIIALTNFAHSLDIAVATHGSCRL